MGRSFKKYTTSIYKIISEKDLEESQV